MTLSRLTFLVTLYVALGVANPVMPGALIVSVEDSLEARVARRVRADAGAIASARVSERLNPNARVVVALFPVVDAPRIRTQVARSRLPLPARPASPEDD